MRQKNSQSLHELPTLPQERSKGLCSLGMGHLLRTQIADFAFTYPSSSTMPTAEKYLDLVVKPLLPASFLGVSRATKEYRALYHGNAKLWCKGRWEGWARLVTFPIILCAEPKSLQSLSITNSLENGPLYRYGGHIELIRFNQIYGIPRGHERDPIYSLSIYARFPGQFFFKFSQKKIVMGKKDRCAVFGCNNDRLFPEKYTVKFSFCPKSACKY